MRDPSISICIINHNYGRFLGQAVDSALGQLPGQYRLAEVLVLDDGSTDDSLDVCARYGHAIRCLTLPHRGFGATLTAAVEDARGDWIALLDADDWLVPHKLATVAAAISDRTLLVQHWEHVVDSAGRPVLDRPHPGGNTSTLIVRRDAALDLLPVTNEAFFHVLDRAGQGVTLTDPLINYRVHDANMTDRTNPGVFQDYLRGVCNDISLRLRDLAVAPPPWSSRSALRRASRHYAAEATGHMREAAVQRGQPIVAKAAAMTAIGLAIAARDLRGHVAGLRSAITMRPTVILGPRESTSIEPIAGGVVQVGEGGVGLGPLDQ